MTIRKAVHFLIPVVILLVLAAGCDKDDNPVDTTEGDHLEAYGVRLMLGDDILAEADGTEVTGVVQVPNGTTTELIELMFLDADGDWYEPEHEHEGEVITEEEHDHELDLGVGDDTVLGYTLGEDIPTADSHWSFTLNGLQEGATTLTVIVLHNGHEDYVSPEIPVTVAAQ